MVIRHSNTLSAVEVVQLTESLAQASQAQVPLAPALQALSEELGRGRLAQSLQLLATRLEAGVALPAAISEVRLPEHIQALIALGIQSNDLPGALEQLIHQQRTARDLRRRLRIIIA